MHYATVKGILSARNGMNLYRGCQHGCIYCDSRSACYHGPRLRGRRGQENAPPPAGGRPPPQTQALYDRHGLHDRPVHSAEDQLRHTRQALELIGRYGFGATLITKSARVLRDLDLLKRINGQTKCVIQMTMTTCDEALCRKIGAERQHYIGTVRSAEGAAGRGHPDGGLALSDPALPQRHRGEYQRHSGPLRGGEVKGVVCFRHGTDPAGGSRDYFYRQLDRLFPGLKEQYIGPMAAPTCWTVRTAARLIAAVPPPL